MIKLRFLLAVGAASLAGSLWAAPVDAVFQIQQPSSSLDVTVRRGILSDSDTKPLTGTINATFDFGVSGALPTVAAVTVTSADVRAVGTYNFTLGFPPFLGINATAAGLIADVKSTTPPGTMTKPAGPGTTYQFDAAQFTVTMLDGDITVSGLFNETVDLSEEDPPIAGASPAGTMGSLALAIGGASGPYTLLNATLNLPVNIAETVMFGEPGSEQAVDLELVATVQATASFYVALSGVPGDFNQDNKVDDADFALWKIGFGKAADATLGDGDANGDGRTDGADFLVWQRNYGIAPPALGSTAIPEPQTMALAVVAVLAVIPRWRR